MQARRQRASIPEQRLNSPMLQVLAWLQLKAQATATALNEASGAFSSMDESTMTAYSVNMVGEYLPPAWLARFQDACAVPAGGAPLIHA